MLLKIIACLLITYGSGWVHCKPWADRYDYSDQSRNYPHGYGDGYGPGPITTSTTTKPLYPTLYPQHQPFSPAGPYAPSAPQLPPPQRPGSNPYDVTPANNHGPPYNNDYHNQPNPNNNFNRPYYDNTQTTSTYRPFIGTTLRPTFPTRQPYNTPVPGSRAPNGTIYHSGNSTKPPQNNYNNNPHGQNPNHYNPNGPNTGNYGSTTYRPFPSANQMNQHGNQNPNQPNNGFPQHNITPIRPNTGNQFPNPNQPNYNPNTGHNQNPNQPNYNPSTGNQFPSPNQPNYNPNTGHIQNPNQPNYNPTGGNQNQGAFMNPNVNQRPDIGPNGVALAPFPGVNSNNNGGQNQYGYDNSQNRPVTNDPNRYNNNNSGGNVPLAGYTGAHVPLA